MFGYRNLGFGSFPSRGVGAFEWSTTLTLGSTNFKNNSYAFGFDTDVHENSASIGSLSDNTIDGMFDSADGASQVVTLTRLTWVRDNTTNSSFEISSLRVKFSPNNQHSGTNGVTWDSVTVNGTQFDFSGTSGSDPWNFDQDVGVQDRDTNDYSYPNASYGSAKNVTNPFGTTSAGGNFTVTFKSAGF